MVFYQEEEELLDKLIDGLSRRKGQVSEQIEVQIKNLRSLAEAVSSYPSLKETGKLGKMLRSEETLIRKLTSQNHIENSLYLPTQVDLGKSFLRAKINFLLMIKYHAEIGIRLKKYSSRLLEIITFNIFSLMSEEILLSIVGSKDTLQELKEGAARKLLNMWDHRLEPVENGSVPILNSMWRARQRLCPTFGSMMGMSEIYQISRFVDPVWFEFLSANEEDDEVFMALEEFIFNLSSEEILIIRKEMTERKMSSISSKKIESIVGRKHFCPDFQKVDPRELLRYYRERSLAASKRAEHKWAGPKKTIEEYLLLFLIGKEEGI
ncbi:MAG: hypothetical protein JEY99_03345 [Spirochaetales bacterium]|nr:hypothetical protein [Spirochaetales bacterium]